jgi:hypothetical protein
MRHARFEHGPVGPPVDATGAGLHLAATKE